jgi:general secretion pathway protein K
VWQQWRAVQVEAAERSRSQSAWILIGALDWARVILKEDAKGSNYDHLGEPWAVPLAEARLSTFLAVDSSHADDAPDTFLSGSISDAQARYNLRNLIDDKADIVPSELETLQRLCVNVNIAASVADQIARGLKAAKVATQAAPASGAQSADTTATPLLQERVEQLVWLGIEAVSLKRLEPHIALLPTKTAVNINTASREVIAAVIPKLDLGSAERLVQWRDRLPFETPAAIAAQLPQGLAQPSGSQLGTTTKYFFVNGRVRLSNHTLEQRSLVTRQGREVKALTREWVNSSDSGNGG